jgi:hypothetical protein
MKAFDYMTWREKASFIAQEMMITGVNPATFFQKIDTITLEDWRQEVARWRDNNEQWSGSRKLRSWIQNFAIKNGLQIPEKNGKYYRADSFLSAWNYKKGSSKKIDSFLNSQKIPTKCLDWSNGGTWLHGSTFVDFCKWLSQ